MYYYDAGMMPLQSKLKKMLDVLLPGSVTLYKGKVTLKDYSIYVRYNVFLQGDQGKKVIGNIYEITPAAYSILHIVLGCVFLKMDGMDVYTPSRRMHQFNESYTNIKNIPNLKWKYETEDKIQTPKY